MHDLQRRAAVQAGGGLVQEDQVWEADDLDAQRQAPALPAGETLCVPTWVCMCGGGGRGEGGVRSIGVGVREALCMCV